MNNILSAPQDAKLIRIVKTLRPPFSRRWRAGDLARAIKSDPEFIALREQLLADVFAQRRQEAWA